MSAENIKDEVGVEGHLDVANQFEISGWVRRPQKRRPLTIDVSVDGHVVAKGVSADVYRQDVEAAGFGDGSYGFYAIFDVPQIANARVTILESGTGMELLQGTISAEPVSEKAERSVERLSNEARVASAVPVTSHTKDDHVSDPVPSFRVHIDELSPEGMLRGWALNVSSPCQLVRLEVLIDEVHYAWTDNGTPRGDLIRHFATNGKGGFQLKLPAPYLAPGVHQVCVRAPDGTSKTKTITLEDNFTPVSLNYNNLSPEGVAVVVPVHNAAEDTKSCIGRLLQFTAGCVEIIIIDDASTDPKIAEILSAAEHAPNIRILKNETNRGFTSTVNRGLAEAEGRDVVILNSDARVTPRWLPNMLAAARSSPRVATVTAMSDRAGAFSAPDIGNDNKLPVGIDEASYARAFRRRQLGTYPAVPTGNGFCMLITRAAIRELGPLDEEAFPRGYGEENDFCMRALRAGWQNLIDDRTYVFHERTKSFGASKQENLEAGARVVRERYPEYKFLTPIFREDSNILLARMQARIARCDSRDPTASLPRALFVVSTSTGGTPQTNADLMRALHNTFDCWLLRCDSNTVELGQFRDGKIHPVRSHKLRKRVDPITHRSVEYEQVVESWLVFYDFDLVHIRHLAWHSLALPTLAKKNHITVIHSFHDFYALCPSVNLVKNGSFCGGACSQTEDGECASPLWPQASMPRVNQSWVRPWRDRYEQAILSCDAFITTSVSARKRILEHLPGLNAEKFFVIPHGRDFHRFGAGAPLPRPHEPFRLLVPGNININKGLRILCDLAAYDTEQRLEIHVLGKIQQSEIPAGARIVTHGSYVRENFLDKVEGIGAHIGVIFSIWDETWCHTLTELWTAGLPTAVFDFPTVAERVRKSGAGWVLDHGEIPVLYEQLLALLTDTDEVRRAQAAVRTWQVGEGGAETTHVMAARYLDVYRSAMVRTTNECGTGGSKTPNIAVVTREGDADRVVDDASALVQLGLRTRNSVERRVNYIPMSIEALLASLEVGNIDGAIVDFGAIPGPWTNRIAAAFKENGVPFVLWLGNERVGLHAASSTHVPWAPYLMRLMAEAVVVAVSNEEQSVGVPAERIEIVPNALPAAPWTSHQPVRRKDGKFRALCINRGGSTDSAGAAWEALGAVATVRPEFEVLVLGAEGQNLPSWAQAIEWPKDVSNYRGFVAWVANQCRDVDVFLCPLVDQPTDTGRVELDVLQAGALGLPVLASEHLALNRFVGLNQVRLLRNEVGLWKDAILDQIRRHEDGAEVDEDLRHEALGRWSIDSSVEEFDSLIYAVLGVRNAHAYYNIKQKEVRLASGEHAAAE